MEEEKTRSFKTLKLFFSRINLVFERKKISLIVIQYSFMYFETKICNLLL